MLHFHGSHLGLVIKTGLVTGIISLTVSSLHLSVVCESLPGMCIVSYVSFRQIFFNQEGIAVGRTFAALKNYQVDGNKEMIAIGLMNIVGSSTSCYVTTGTFPFISNAEATD
jgi:sulfate transporter 3